MPEFLSQLADQRNNKSDKLLENELRSRQVMHPTGPTRNHTDCLLSLKITKHTKKEVQRALESEPEVPESQAQYNHPSPSPRLVDSA